MRDELNAAILWARSILAHKLRNIVIIVGATLIFYGAVHLGELLSLVLLVVGTRATFIAFELINRPPLLSELPAIGEQLLSHYKNLTPERRERAALEFGLDENATPESFVVAALAQIKSEILNRRTSPELITDLFGLITYCAILPINLLLYTRDFVSPHSNQEWFGALLLLFGLILYVWPLKWQTRSTQPTAAGSCIAI